MRLPTYGEIEYKVRLDLDLQDTDNFIGQDEMAGVYNEGVATAEALIMKACEDYFKTFATLSLVQGSADIALPADIYAQKIREIVYKNGDRIFPLRELKDPQMHYRKAVIDRQAVSLDEYMYFLKSATAGAQDSLVIVPPALESGAYLEMWYIRNAKRAPLQSSLADGATRATQIAAVLDIPEWRAYVEKYMKAEIYEHKIKDKGAAALARADLGTISGVMIDDLRDRMKNNENEIPQDISHYVEHN